MVFLFILYICFYFNQHRHTQWREKRRPSILMSWEQEKPRSPKAAGNKQCALTLQIASLRQTASGSPDYRHEERNHPSGVRRFYFATTRRQRGHGYQQCRLEYLTHKLL